jgi:hypothetical protein
MKKLALTLLQTSQDFGGSCLDNRSGWNRQTPYQQPFFDLSSASKQTLQRPRQQLQHLE